MIRLFVRRFSSCAAADVEELLKCGSSFTLAREFSLQDLVTFSQLSQDSNPIHTELAAAQAAGFPSCVVHGMLTAGMFPAIIGSRFPGAIYRTQTLEFHEPAFAGDKLEAQVTILSSVKLKRRYKVTFSTSCSKRSAPGPDSVKLVDGVAVAVITP